VAVAIALCGAVSAGSAADASAACHVSGARVTRACHGARPRARTRPALRIAAGSAVVRGLLSGGGTPTTFRFRYAIAGSAPRFTAPAYAPAGRGRVQVQATLQRLSAGRTYLYQVIATNRFGTADGATGRFVTPGPRARTSGSTQPVSPPAPGRKPSIGPTTTSTSHNPTAVDPTPTTTTSINQPTPPSPSTSPLASAPMLWGAELGTQFTQTQAPWDMTPVTDFAHMVGKTPAVLPYNIPFEDCTSSCYWYWFPTQQMDKIRSYGTIPMLNWGSMSLPMTVDEPGFSLSAVINGNFDTYLQQFAQQAQAWGHPFFLRFDWEMNGNWFPWNEGVNGNQSGQFAAAWRHVHDIFVAAGATNVTWVWCPVVTEEGVTTPLAGLYPGDAYVDWTCMDGYNWGTALHGPNGWLSFDQVFGATYAELTKSVAPSKPVMIGEVASSENGGSKAAWITTMFAELPTVYPSIRALLWFDDNESMDAAVETSASSLAAFSHGIASSQYLTNSYSGLDAGTIGFP
jgi:hypothetical protein